MECRFPPMGLGAELAREWAEWAENAWGYSSKAPYVARLVPKLRFTRLGRVATTRVICAVLGFRAELNQEFVDWLVRGLVVGFFSGVVLLESLG
ncbi:hypothetical protein Q31a_54590 [Aureliella helgolandensis]|uniref:Uncharacterized protein n=1 Tax=Aureliella helgolandensis TaxID=2527968 RepID=A0A518GEV1_9BACT|nr:hypothetical protein Q31a_54590 [Aureliella helgolandensis]